MNDLKSLPTIVDRYPAKMVSHLADQLILKYCSECRGVFDPFCGSGAILAAAKNRGLPVVGCDLNPYATLLSSVKLNGFDSVLARKKCTELLSKSINSKKISPISWENKHYWFTSGTLYKYEQFRYVALEENLKSSREGLAILLAFALSVRRCSRADQRSPKPFISKSARLMRAGKHFDPFREIPFLLDILADRLPLPSKVRSSIFNLDVADKNLVKLPMVNGISHVITSPPYLNAQDYFRNSKLELHLLSGLLNFNITNLKLRMIGTERGNLTENISNEELERNKSFFSHLHLIEKRSPQKASIIHRYFYDMYQFVSVLSKTFKSGTILVIVCGDNLVDGLRVPTADILNRMLMHNKFTLFDTFTDNIQSRHVPPTRLGHKGIIKQEIISAFKKIE
jgi:hypothetical protein